MLLVLAAAALASAQPPQWQVLVQDGEGVVHYDPATARDDGARRRSMRVRVRVLQPIDNGAVEIVSRTVVDRGARTYAYSEIEMTGRDATSLGSVRREISDITFNPVQSGSVQERILGHLCDRR